MESTTSLSTLVLILLLDVFFSMFYISWRCRKCLMSCCHLHAITLTGILRHITQTNCDSTNDLSTSLVCGHDLVQHFTFCLQMLMLMTTAVLLKITPPAWEQSCHTSLTALGCDPLSVIHLVDVNSQLRGLPAGPAALKKTNKRSSPRKSERKRMWCVPSP